MAPNTMFFFGFGHRLLYAGGCGSWGGGCWTVGVFIDTKKRGTLQVFPFYCAFCKSRFWRCCCMDKKVVYHILCNLCAVEPVSNLLLLVVLHMVSYTVVTVHILEVFFLQVVAIGRFTYLHTYMYNYSSVKALLFLSAVAIELDEVSVYCCIE